MKNKKNHLTLKWGTLKSYRFVNKKARELLKEYFDIGVTMGAMMQKNTPRQKEIICQLIDLCDDDKIYLDFYDVYLSKEAAKLYVLNYKNPGYE